jgi:hypothetical protein
MMVQNVAVHHSAGTTGLIVVPMECRPKWALGMLAGFAGLVHVLDCRQSSMSPLTDVSTVAPTLLLVDHFAHNSPPRNVVGSVAWIVPLALTCIKTNISLSSSGNFEIKT